MLSISVTVRCAYQLTFVVVSACPTNVVITPPDPCNAYSNITCSADADPPALFRWIDHMNGDSVSLGPVFTVKPGFYNLTCQAYINVSCSQANPICRDTASMAYKFGNDPNFPFQLFSLPAIQNGASRQCDANKTIGGYAVGEYRFNRFQLLTIRPSVKTTIYTNVNGDI